MEEQWYSLKEALKGRDGEIRKINEPFFYRLLKILSTPNYGVADIATAYSDALRCSLSHNLSSASLYLNQEKYDYEVFTKAGLTYDYTLSEVSLIDDSAESFISDVYRRTKRRRLAKIPIDLALQKAIGDDHYTSYNGDGQALAVRTTLLSEPDATLLIDLPTGCGKTFVVHSLMLFTSSQRLTLVIVPTVGLALEQSARAKDVLKKACKDHGGEYCLIGGQTEEVQRSIIERVNGGQQRILFTSPEMAMRRLLPSIFRLTQSDQLASVVVDEAHLIDQWGAEFRSEFQQLAPFVMSLRKSSRRGIRTVLLSATYSPYTVSTLENLFGGEKELQIIKGTFLRPEPYYQANSLSDYQSYFDAVCQAIWSLPRPLIVYTTTRREAEHWYAFLRTSQFNRIALFHGETDSGTRSDLIRQWQNEDIDVMVATSAFGVGMDKEDVRSVLHVSVPENLDRFYQESGRGGRDGNASLSYLICHKEQFNTAQDLNQEKLISSELGIERWRSMLQDKRDLPGGLVRINLNSRRHGLSRDTKRNRTWNWLTLLLMQRAKLIRLHFSPPEASGESGQTLPGQDLAQYYDEYFNSVNVEIIHDGHLSETTWKSEVEIQRAIEKSARKDAFRRLKSWIQDAGEDAPSQPLCSLLCEFYAFQGYEPERACGGCPACVANKRAPYSPTLGNPSTALNPGANVPDFFGKLVRVYYQPDQRLKMLLRTWKPWIVSLLNSGKVQAVRAQTEVFVELGKILPNSTERFWCAVEMDAPPSNYDELVLVMPGEKQIPDLKNGGGAQILIAPENLPDRDFPYRKWCDGHADAQSINSFVGS